MAEYFAYAKLYIRERESACGVCSDRCIGATFFALRFLRLPFGGFCEQSFRAHRRRRSPMSVLVRMDVLLLLLLLPLLLADTMYADNKPQWRSANGTMAREFERYVLWSSAGRPLQKTYWYVCGHQPFDGVGVALVVIKVTVRRTMRSGPLIMLRRSVSLRRRGYALCSFWTWPWLDAHWIIKSLGAMQKIIIRIVCSSYTS